MKLTDRLLEVVSHKNYLLRFAGLVSTIMILTGCASEALDKKVKTQSAITSIEDAIVSIFDEFSNSSHPRVSVGVRRGDDYYFYTFGQADVAQSRAIDAQTPFNIGSVSKQFTVFAALLLRDDGLITIQDDIRTYIPELQYQGPTITIEDLMRHTSGLKSVNYLSLLNGWLQSDKVTHDQMLSLIFRQERLNFSPGEAYEYSNSNTALLAEIVQRVSKQPFDVFMRDRVFGPLDMTNSFIRTDEAKLIPREVQSYYFVDEELKHAINPKAPLGYTNVYSTAADLLNWANNFRDVRVGSQQIISDMQSHTQLPTKRVTSHAMGQFVEEYREFQHIQHTGSHRGYLAYLGRYPDQELDIVILTNVEGMDMLEKGFAVANLFLPKPTSSNLAEQSETPPPDSQNAYPIKSDQLENYRGHYWSPTLRLAREIDVIDGTLVYKRSSENTSALRPTSDTTFQMQGIQDKVVFSFNNAGFTLDYNGDVDEFISYDPADTANIDVREYGGIYYSHTLNAVMEIVPCNGFLTALMAKRPPILFEPVTIDEVKSDAWFLSHLSFRRDDAETVDKLYASNVGASEVLYIRIEAFGAQSIKASGATACATKSE